MGKEYYELTAPQKSIWLTEQYYKNTNINNLCGTFYSNEKIDFELLKQSLNIFLKNNDSFKIMLDYTNDKVSQYFSEIDYIDFEVIDIKNDKDLENLENKVSSKCFNILNSLLFEAVLFRYPDGHGGFIFNSHHIVSDSWANGIVANDVGLIYSKLKNNEDYSKSPELSYKAYINAEKEYVNSPKFEKDKKYWEDIFSTVPEVATIPSVKETLKDDDLSANRLLLNIDSEILIRLNDYCVKYKISLYNFFMTVFALYLGRVSNLDDFVIGTPILNRANYKEKQTTGMFINTLPLRINLSHDKTFIDNLKDIAINSMSLLRHQKYSFQYIIEDLRKKDSNLPKLYNVLYSYQVTKMNETTDCLNHTSSWIFNKTISDDLDIHMFEWDKDNSIKIAYDYRTNKYEEQDMKDIHARILHVINQVLENEEILLKDIEIVTPEEKHKILYEFNDTKVDYPKDKTIIDLFEEQVEKTPDNIAVVFEDQQLTYRELNEKANQLARYMISEYKIQPQDTVGVYLKKGIDFIISVFAILKCNAIYMPIFYDYPIDRISYMINNSNCKLLITLSNNQNIKSLNINSIFINSILCFDNLDRSNNINLSISVNSLAYIIYTSGSTGKPKGVCISHNNLVNFVYAFNKYFKEINNEDSFLSSTNIAFDVSIWEIFVPLLNGAKLYFNSTDIINDIRLYCDNIIKNNINALYIPPNILNEVFDILKKENYNKISKLLVGVESITNTTLNNYIDLNPNIIIINGYGPTETTICATALEYKKDLSNAHTISIGKPLYNNQIYILWHNTLCPINTPGELYVSGDGVGYGYLNDELKTNKVFKTDIFSTERIMYATGDLASWNPDGTIKFIGRRDNQIKLHGYRIELGEIDTTLMKHPAINKSISLLNNNNIVTYYLSEDNISLADIKIFLKSKLPFYMVPHHIINLDNLPLTINGKIDKTRLPEPNLDLNNNYIAPRTEIEQILCNIWCSLFNKEKISITDNFFELGGDSLTAIKLQTEALKYNININYGDIFSNPTIENLAKNRLNIHAFNIDKNYNYDNINKLLSINCTNNIPNVIDIKDRNGVLLLGSTGFLGAHILDNLLTNTNSTVYCLVRSKNSISPENRLIKVLNFYFGEKYNDFLGNRIIVINGDITSPNLSLNDISTKLLKNNISCVINSAAFVKHYGNFNEFNKINIEGTKNIINFCKKLKIELYHISTISVSGIGKLLDNKNAKDFYETDLYLNQNLDNAYIYTKFQSEVLILEAISLGLKATILRLGNISNRYYDGKFQINFSDNAYLNRLKAFLSIGMLPKDFVNHAVDFSPVDYCADAIVKIVFSQSPFSVFHIFNNNLLTFSNIISYLNNMNYNINFVGNKKFRDTISYILNSENEKNKISGIIPDLDSNRDLNLIFDIIPNNDFSNNFLKKLGFIWPNIDFNYFKLLIDYFKDINYLN